MLQFIRFKIQHFKKAAPFTREQLFYKALPEYIHNLLLKLFLLPSFVGTFLFIYLSTDILLFHRSALTFYNI